MNGKDYRSHWVMFWSSHPVCLQSQCNTLVTHFFFSKEKSMLIVQQSGNILVKTLCELGMGEEGRPEVLMFNSFENRLSNIKCSVDMNITQENVVHWKGWYIMIGTGVQSWVLYRRPGDRWPGNTPYARLLNLINIIGWLKNPKNYFATFPGKSTSPLQKWE